LSHAPTSGTGALRDSGIHRRVSQIGAHLLVRRQPIKTAEEAHREYVQAMWALFLVLAGLVAGCSSQSSLRFTHTSPNQYIMFDNKTAQACWSGPVWHDSLKTIQTDLNDAARERGETRRH
jgi:hypothetical protein